MFPLSYHMPARNARSSCRAIRLTGSAHGDNISAAKDTIGGRAVSDFVKVASVSDVSPGEVLLVDVDGDRVALVNVDGELYAVRFGIFTDEGPIPNSGAVIRVGGGNIAGCNHRAAFSHFG